MGDAHVLKLLQKDEDILLEYYLTKDVTELHRKELTYLFDMPHGEKTLMGDVGHQRAEDEVSNNVEYHRLTSQFKFQKPFRRPLFNYEPIVPPSQSILPYYVPAASARSRSMRHNAGSE